MAITIDVLNLGEAAADVTGTTVALTTTSAAAAGSTIILTGSFFNGSGTATSVADNGPGLTWVVDKNGAGTDVNSRAFIAHAYAPAGLASGRTITVTFSASVAGGKSLAASSFMGIPSSAPLDTTSGPTSYTGTAWTSASTAIAAGSLLIAVVTDFHDSHTNTPTAPSIESHEVSVPSGYTVVTEYRIEAAGASYTVAGTWSDALANGVVIAAAYKAAAGATAPGVPQSLAASAGNATVSLTWSAPASDGGSAVTGYKIYRATSSGAETLFASPAGIGTSYTDSAVSNGTTYYYKVTAVNAIGEGALSNEASALPVAPVTTAARTLKRFYGPTLLSNAASTLYVVPPSTTAVVRHIHVSNPSGSPVDFTLSIGTNAQGTRIWDAQPIPADDVLDHYQEFTLVTSEIIQGFAGSASVLNLTIDGYEVSSVITPPPAAIYPSDTLFPSDTSP